MAPALLERIIPGLGRRHTERGFVSLFSVALSKTITEDDVDDSTLLLWRGVNALALGACIQLFVKNLDATFNTDWGFRPYWGRLKYRELVTVGYWMNLYFIRLFRDKGLLGQANENTLINLATRWIDWWTDELKLARLESAQRMAPTDDSLISVAQTLYDRVCELISVEPSIAKRTVGVAAFLTMSDLQAETFKSIS